MTTTKHGQNIANQIVGEDSYGGSGSLTGGDVHEILDQIHTNFCDQAEDLDKRYAGAPTPESVSVGLMLRRLSKWMEEISE